MPVRSKLTARILGLAAAALLSSLTAFGSAEARLRTDGSDPFGLFFGEEQDETAAPAGAAIPREIVGFPGGHAPGTIIVSTAERRLYFVLSGGQAVRYGIGVGRPGFAWGGVQTITRKAVWPAWTPPAAMLRRRPDLPRHMVGGEGNPLGARALYLGGSLYRIHGSNEPHTIGQAVSSGCIRMLNEDVVDLYERVRVGTRVVVLR